MSVSGTNEKVPQARLCHVVKWDGFDGYGFNLHAEKGKSGQYIGKVDEGSPSEAAGLKQGDRIIEVNEINISNEAHKQVVERIKAFPNETKLLVVDHEADEYFKANNIVIKGTLPNVKVIKTPEKNPALDDDSVDTLPASTTSTPQPPTPPADNTEDEHHDTANDYARSVSSNSSIDEVAQKSISSMDSGSTAPAAVNNNSGIELSRENGNRIENGTIETKGTAGSGNGNSNVSMSGAEQKSLNLKMSAKELRAQLAARKKFDPKKESMDFKLKFDIVQKL